MKNEKVWKIAMTGVFAALSYVVFTFLQFKIWLPCLLYTSPSPRDTR